MNHKFIRFSSEDRDVPALRKTWVAGIVASASLPAKFNAQFNRGKRDNSGETSTRWLLKIPLIQGSGDGGFLSIQRELDWEKKLPKVLTAGQILITNYCSRNGVIENNYQTKKGEEKTELIVYNNAQHASKSSVILISTHIFDDFHDFDDFWDEKNDLIAEHGSIIHGSTPSLADDSLVKELRWIHEVYLEMTDDKKFKNIFAFDRRIPFDRDIISLRDLQLRYQDYDEDEKTDPEDSSERVDLRPSLLVRVSQLSSFFIFWLYDASNPDSTYSNSFINFDKEPEPLQEMRNLNRRSKIFPIDLALNYFLNRITKT
ncbi:unnamed protein product [Oikopleura dioica]|uniref:Uncharacterized protein n=1 Tax=Oikopleura dioica TaxID=34765 RepID=E4XVT1_OIKDI|nr:unnamed protein product [Oikopleura dioica]